MKKFFEFKNITQNTADLFIYGEIVQEKSVDWWTGEESDTDVSIMDFKEELEKIGNVQTLNIYINSPGGDVFVASAMISMLERKKQSGTTINAYVDGVSASAASFLMCVADNIYMYKNSVVMIHKPMSFAYGNANDIQKVIDTLDKIESATMLPMYMSKAKISEDELKEFINNETWFSAPEMEEYFNVTVLNEEKVAVASISNELFKKYKNIPENIRKVLNNFHQKPNLDNTLKDYQDDVVVNKNEENIKTRLSLIKGFLIAENLKEGE